LSKTLKNSLIAGVACFAFMLLILNVASFAQEKKQGKKVSAKLLAEIAGNYEFEFQGEYIVFVFSAEDGKLMCAPEGEVQEEIEPIEGEKMTFVGYAPDGREFRFAFERDDKGKISKCKVNVPAMGIEVEGVKIKD
jgi:hypothetical protein